MKRGILGIILLGVGITLYSLMGEDEDPTAYIEAIGKMRVDKNEFMSVSPESPFNKYGDTTVVLQYFPVDPKYKVTARVELCETKQYITLGTSSGEPTRYLKYAYLHFEIDNTPMQMLVLKDPEARRGALFTAFADQTSTIETYGGGRYMDLDFKRANRITLDFNTAYNPYCNYNESYSCPFPPNENLLPVRIEAGEKVYGK